MSTLRAARMPSMIYGTAWKKDHTRALVKQALLTGFRGVDTAAQPKHYQESLVGEGMRDALKVSPDLKREHLYIQTKFTSVHGQDPRSMPYDPAASVTEQVKASVASSLQNLRHSDNQQESAYIDCLVLHSPLPSPEATAEAWQAMEHFVPHSVRTLGISNVYDPALLDLICHDSISSVKPSVVQNRFYEGNDYDVRIRAYCAARNFSYQAFWTLTGNPSLLRSESVNQLAFKANVTKEVALYGLICNLPGEVVVLNGTTNAQRMSNDLEMLERLQQYSEKELAAWSETKRQFGGLIEGTG